MTALGGDEGTKPTDDTPPEKETALGAAPKEGAEAKPADDAAKAAADKLAADLQSTDPAVKAAAEKAVKDKEAAEKKSGAPETYAEFKMPEGMVLDKAALEQFAPVAKELGLSQEGAQKLVDLFAAQRAKDGQQVMAEWEKTQAAWLKSAQDDAEIGGTNFNANLAVAGKALKAFGGEAFTKMLNATGIGDHPEMLRFAYKVGQAISEEKLVLGADKKPAKTAAEIMYPSAQS